MLDFFRTALFFFSFSDLFVFFPLSLFLSLSLFMPLAHSLRLSLSLSFSIFSFPSLLSRLPFVALHHSGSYLYWDLASLPASLSFPFQQHLYISLSSFLYPFLLSIHHCSTAHLYLGLLASWDAGMVFFSIPFMTLHCPLPTLQHQRRRIDVTQMIIKLRSRVCQPRPCWKPFHGRHC